jgi:hypothetical protein
MNTTERLRYLANPERGIDDPHDIGFYESCAIAEELLSARAALTAAEAARPIVTINGDGEATRVEFRGEVFWEAGKLSAPSLRTALDECKATLAAHRAILAKGAKPC